MSTIPILSSDISLRGVQHHYNGHFCRNLLLVPKSDGTHVRRSLGQISFLADLPGCEPHVLSHASARPARHGAPCFLLCAQYESWNVVASLGAFLLGVSTLPFIVNIVASCFLGRPAGNNPWHATGLEWTTSSPPPVENFAEIPIVTDPPYHYDGSGPRTIAAS